MTFTKDPHAVLDYTVDWNRWLAGDTIATSTWLVPAGLTKQAESKTNTAATASQSYTVTNRITSAAGRTEERSFTIRVEER